MKLYLTYKKCKVLSLVRPTPLNYYLFLTYKEQINNKQKTDIKDEYLKLILVEIINYCQFLSNKRKKGE